MPKIKTSRAAAKRFKKTGTGKVVEKVKPIKRHILTKEIPEEKEKSEKSNNHGSDQR